MLARENEGLSIPMEIFVSCRFVGDDANTDEFVMPVHQWWGRKTDSLNMAAAFRRPNVTLDLQP